MRRWSFKCQLALALGLGLAGVSSGARPIADCAAYNRLAEAHLQAAAALTESATAAKLTGEPGWPVDLRGTLFARPPRNLQDLKGRVESDWTRVDIGKTDCFVSTLSAKADHWPWHDLLAHGKLAILAGGPDYGEDGYFAAAAVGGRIPFYPDPQDALKTLRTRFLMAELSEDLALCRYAGFRFEDSPWLQHASFRGGTEVYANRSDFDWPVAGQLLPPDGFYACNADREVGVVKMSGRRRAFARSRKERRFFVDARRGGEQDFGGIVTAGALRLDFGDEWHWTAEALPGEGEFTARIDLTSFRTSPRPIERITGAKDWKLDGDRLLLAFDADCRKVGIRFREPRRLELQAQIDAAAAQGGGKVVVPAGEWESAPIVLKDNVTLRLEAGATLYASTNIAEYAAARGERVFLYADHARNVAVEGSGTLDGRGYLFRESVPIEGASQPQDLPVLMRFSRCENIRLEDFRYTRSGAWGCHLRNNSGVVVRRVKCFNHSNKTNDGIDIESSNVLIEDCDFDSDDDALVIKTESDITFPVTNIVVRNCRLATTCNGLKAGSGSYCTVRDVLMENCRIERPGADWRFRWYDYIPGVTNRLTCNTAVNFAVVDGGRLENLTIRNVTFEGVRVPMCFRLSRRHENTDGQPVYLRNVLIENFRGSCDSTIPSQITGVPGMRPENFVLRNVEITAPGGGLATSQPVPEAERGFPGPWMLIQDERYRPSAAHLNAWGFYLRHADGITFDHVKLNSVLPDARPPIHVEDCTRVDLGDHAVSPFAGGIQAELDRAANAGGGRVTIPAGEWITGALELKSNVELHLEEGARLVFPDDPKFFPLRSGMYEGLAVERPAPLIGAFGATNVAVTGKGELHARIDYWERNHRMLNRPVFLQFLDCKRVKLEDIRIRNSPSWTMHFALTDDVVVRRVNSVARGHNNDGIDLDSVDGALIEDCFLDQGDDAICMKSGKNEQGRRRARPTRNVTIRRCTIGHGHTLLGIGSELSGGIENVLLEDCTVTGEVWRVMLVKTNRARGGFARNITVRNVRVNRAKCAIAGITCNYSPKNPENWATAPKFTEIGNLRVENVICDRAWYAYDLDAKEATVAPKDIVIRNCSVAHPERGCGRAINIRNLVTEDISADPGPFAIWTSDADDLFSSGENAIFRVEAVKDVKTAEVRLDDGSGKPISTVNVDLTKQHWFKVSGTRTTPGYLTLTVKGGGAEKVHRAAFDLDRIPGTE